MKCPWLEYKTIKKDGMAHEYEWKEWGECYGDECPFYRGFTVEVVNSAYCLRSQNNDPAEHI